MNIKLSTPCQTQVSGLGSAGQGDVVFYDGLVGGEGHVPEVEGGQVLELSPLPRMQMEKHEEDIASHVHSDVCYVLKVEVWSYRC